MVNISDLSEDFDKNYDLFIATALATGCVWALQNDEGFALCPSVDNDELDVMPLWSEPEYAEYHCRDEWRAYKLTPISVEELLDDWLPGMHEDLTLVGVNWSADLEGIEIEPLDLLEDIDRESSSD